MTASTVPPTSPVATATPSLGARSGAPTWGLGRRKSSIARVRIRPGKGVAIVNGRPLDEYFLTVRDRQLARSPLALAGTEESYDVWVRVEGGGPHGQAGAMRLGLARALKSVNPTLFEGLPPPWIRSSRRSPSSVPATGSAFARRCAIHLATR